MRDTLRTLLLLALPCAAPLAPAASPLPAPAVLRIWVTSADGARRLAPGPDVAFAASAADPAVIEVDPSRRYQAFVGVGAAITDATALTLERGLDAAARERLLAELFGPAPGLGLGLVRVPIGASDFSPRHYTLDDTPDGAPDPTLSRFAMPPEALAVLGVTRRAQALNPALRVIASPWSAPAWMKDNGSLVTGHLRPEAYGPFADYLLRFADEYARAGVPLYALTIQNEPGTEPANYPGMRVDPPARAAFIAGSLGPRLAARRDAPALLEWDHNWDAPASPLAVLSDPAAARYVEGVAWHCYYGDVAAQDVVHDAYPAKDAFITECSGGGWSPDWGTSLRFLFGTVMVDGTRHWARGVVLWNLALDENAGPHLGGCKNCRGVVTVDTRTGEVTRNVEYYALAHFSRFIRPGAVRVAATSGIAGLRTVALQNPDGTIVLAVCNDGAALTFSVRSGTRVGHVALEGGAVATLIWTPDPAR